jgi:hypothetical protein
MFDEFKKEHGGLGPIQLLFDEATGGALSFNTQRKVIGGMMDATKEAVNQNPNLTPELKSDADTLLARGVYDAKTALANVQKVQQQANQQIAVQQGYSDYTDQSNKLRADAPSLDHIDQLDTMNRQAKTARDWMLSTDPEVQKNGLALQAGVLASQRDYAKQVTSDNIAAANLKASTDVAAEKERYTRDTAGAAQLWQKLNPIDTTKDALENAFTLNNNPNASNTERLAAFNQVIEAIDPAAKRDPSGRYESGNSLVTQLQSQYARALGSPDTAAFKDVNQIIRDSVTSLDKQRERYITSARQIATAYGGDPERVTAGTHVDTFEPAPDSTGGPPKPADGGGGDRGGDKTAGAPSAVEKAAAATKAAFEVANDNTPDWIKTAAGMAGLTTAGRWAPWMVRGAMLYPLATVAAAGAVGLDVLTSVDPRKGLAVAPQELTPQGTVRGVYVPQFLRHRAFGLPERNTDEIK